MDSADVTFFIPVKNGLPYIEECIESIRTESCSNPIETISRLAACRTSDMCLKVYERNR